MKTNYNYILLFCVALMSFGACKKEEQKKTGNPVIEPVGSFSAAHFGDSLEFRVNVSDDQVPLSTLKAQLFFGQEKVSEEVIRTKQNGEYSGKLYIPFLPDIPNGEASLKLVLQNINLTLTEQEIALPLSRPDFPYLTLVTAEQRLTMERTDLYEYTLLEDLPAKVKGYIEAPAVGEQGNLLNFGWQDNEVVLGSTDAIPFSNFASGTYAITFNTLDFQASPFIIAYAINGQVMDRLDDEHFQLDLNLSQGESLRVDGIDNLQDWWIDADFIAPAGEGEYTFLPSSGEYRITADFELEYLKFEALSGGSLARLQADGSGAVWIIGEGIGKPGVSTNQVGWNTDKGLCMAPIGNKQYQITVVAGQSVKSDDINFKFFHQRDWGGEFSGSDLSSSSDLIFVGDGQNGRDSGNLGLKEGVSLIPGKTYVFTLDLSEGNDKAQLSVSEK